mgnify:CR=1 FL=1
MTDTEQAGNELTTKQKRAIACLLTHSSTTAAAAAADVSEKTVYRWLKDPAFLQALHQEEGAAISQATRGLVILQEKALEAIADVFALATEQERVNIADFLTEEPKAVFIGKGENKQTFYIESGSLNWDAIKERGHLIKKISFNQYGPVLELYDAQAAAGLKLRAAESVLTNLLKLRELAAMEERVTALEAAQSGNQKAN